MQMRCLGSSSSGNCYLIENDRECLVLEAGLPFKEVKKALDFNTSKIAGILVSHEHGDHGKYISDYFKAGIHCGMSEGTANELNNQATVVMKPGHWYGFREFTVTPFSVIHDAAEPLGFIIRHQEMGTLLFATDTEYIKQNFKKLNLNHIMIECNYSQKIIDGRVHQHETVKGLRDRILKSHMELETCKEFIRASQTINLDNIILLHLSDGNSDENLFKKEMLEVTRHNSSVTVADKGVTVNLDTIPFFN